jgi:Fur family ferric uptake transcriptional regulator
MGAAFGSAEQAPWAEVGDVLRARGMRWTPQRRLLIRVLADSEGHVTASELIERCRAQDPETTPSTVYRTLDVLEELGIVRHAHAADGREEYHVLPRTEHGHLHCRRCGQSWEIEADEAAVLVRRLRQRRGFEIDLSHLSVAGLCAACQRAKPISGSDARGTRVA